MHRHQACVSPFAPRSLQASKQKPEAGANSTAAVQPFTFRPNLPPVDRIDLNSNFREPGDNSYMRETVASALMKCAPFPTGTPLSAAMPLFRLQRLLGARRQQLHVRDGGVCPHEVRKQTINTITLLAANCCRLDGGACQRIREARSPACQRWNALFSLLFRCWPGLVLVVLLS